MSPEQLEGNVVDPRADIFSLGVVLHEALTGKLPYSSVEPNVLRREIVSGVKNVSAPDMPAELKRIRSKAMQRSPQQRHSSAAHLAADLRRYLSKPRSSLWPWMLLIVILAVAVRAYFSWKAQQAAPVDLGRDEKQIGESQKQVTEKQKPPLTFSDWMAQGKKNFDQSYFKKAAEDYTQAILLEPGNAVAYDKRGVCRFNSGELQASLPDFTKALELDPKNADFCKHRMLSYANLRDFDHAIADGEKTLTLNPADPAPIRDLLARVYSNRAGQRAKAELYIAAAEDVTQAMKHDPKAANYCHQRGSCYYNLKEYEKAAADFTGAIEREPNKASHYLNRGHCWAALGQEKKAAEDYEKAKSLGEK